MLTAGIFLWDLYSSAFGMVLIATKIHFDGTANCRKDQLGLDREPKTRSVVQSREGSSRPSDCDATPPARISQPRPKVGRSLPQPEELSVLTCCAGVAVIRQQ